MYEESYKKRTFLSDPQPYMTAKLLCKGTVEYPPLRRKQQTITEQMRSTIEEAYDANDKITSTGSKRIVGGKVTHSTTVNPHN